MEPFVAPGTLDSLAPIGQYVMKVAAEAGLDKSAAYRLRLSVDEVVTNIIVHGYEEAGRRGEVQVAARVGEDDVRLSIEDTGVSFDPRQMPPPDDLDAPLEEREIGGLGVYLAIQGVDGFEYERVGDRNRNTFIVKRHE